MRGTLDESSSKFRLSHNSDLNQTSLIIVVYNGTTDHSFVQEHYPAATILAVGSYSDCFNAIVEEDAHVWFGDAININYFFELYLIPRYSFHTINYTFPFGSFTKLVNSQGWRGEGRSGTLFFLFLMIIIGWNMTTIY